VRRQHRLEARLRAVRSHGGSCRATWWGWWMRRRPGGKAQRGLEMCLHVLASGVVVRISAETSHDVQAVAGGLAGWRAGGFVMVMTEEAARMDKVERDPHLPAKPSLNCSTAAPPTAFRNHDPNQPQQPRSVQPRLFPNPLKKTIQYESWRYVSPNTVCDSC